MNPDFLETEALQKGAAGRVLRKDPAGELVQSGRFSRRDQRGEHHAAGAVAAVIPSYIDREFADAAVAGPAAVGERSCKSDWAGFPGFGDDYDTLSSKPHSDVCSRARLRLERGDAVGDALIVDFGDRGRIGDCRRPRVKISHPVHRQAESAPCRCSYHPRVRNTIRTTESMTGTSTSTPTTVASAAPD